MKKSFCIMLALAAVLALAAPAESFAYDGARTGQRNTLAAGLYSSAVVDEDGGLWMCGFPYNLPGNVAGNMVNSSGNPIQSEPLKVMDGVRSVSVGYQSNAVIKNDNTLWMWGRTDYGVIGNKLAYDYTEDVAWGKIYYQKNPAPVLDRVAAVSCGDVVTAAIREDGSLWMWGDPELIKNGVKGRQVPNTLGTASKTIAVQDVPVQVMTGVSAVSCGNQIVSVVKSDGSLWAWGRYLEPVKLLDGASSVSSGDSHLVALKTDGSVWTYSQNWMGEAGNGSSEMYFEYTGPHKVLDGCVSVSAGDGCCLAVKKNGDLMAWGDVTMFRLGTGAFRLSQISGNYSDEDKALVPVKILGGVSFAAQGAAFSGFAAKKDGSVWAWGSNGGGMLGNGFSGNYLTTFNGGGGTPNMSVPGLTHFPAPADPGSVPVVKEQPSSWAKADVDAAVKADLVPESLQCRYKEPATRAEFCALAAALYEKQCGKIKGRVSFADTDDENVQKMAYLGVVDGVGSGKFAPDRKLTREQAATMLSRLSSVMEKPMPAHSMDFTDAGLVSDWAAEAVGQMQQSGVMNGMGDGRFSPKGDFTIEQSIVTMLRMYDFIK